MDEGGGSGRQKGSEMGGEGEWMDWNVRKPYDGSTG